MYFFFRLNNFLFYLMSQQLSLQSFSGFLLVKQQQPNYSMVKIKMKDFQYFSLNRFCIYCINLYVELHMTIVDDR